MAVFVFFFVAVLFWRSERHATTTYALLFANEIFHFRATELDHFSSSLSELFTLKLFSAHVAARLFVVWLSSDFYVDWATTTNVLYVWDTKIGSKRFSNRLWMCNQVNLGIFCNNQFWNFLPICIKALK